MSPDGKGYILIQENNQTVNIYKVTKKDDGKMTGQLTLQFPEVHMHLQTNIKIFLLIISFASLNNCQGHVGHF